MTTTHEYVLPVTIVAYAAHMLEEYLLDWRGWARRTYRRPITWGLFWSVNGVIIVAGFCAALIGWKAPRLSLILPALAVLDAVVLHTLPTVWYGQFSPGLLSGLAFLLPGAVWAFVGAWMDGVLAVRDLPILLAGGVAIMLYPFALIMWLQPRYVQQHAPLSVSQTNSRDAS